MVITIIGVGLIGGSFALSLRKNNIAHRIIGVDHNEEHGKTAIERGIVDEMLPLDEAIEQSEMIVLSTPVDTIPLLAIKVLNKVTSQVVIDMGSTKGELSEIIDCHPRRARFVLTHPMWGTENSGPESAVSTGFSGRVLVICDKHRSDEDAVNLVEGIYTKLDMPIKYMAAEDHDVHAAYISHISHVTSFALALTVLDKEREEDRIFDLAGAGFESTVRLAKSSYTMWSPIFMQNRFNVLDVLREHIHQLQIIKKVLEKGDRTELEELIKKANTIRRILK
ncbi:MAG: prephenate dehydrogenase [Rikenellaceae bacterium]